MKKLIFTSLVAFLFINPTQAQENLDALKKGKWMLETNLSPFSSTGTTGFMYNKSKNLQTWAVGGEVGYFVIDRLAIKAGAGYGKSKVDMELSMGLETLQFFRESKSFNYKIGAKYYIINAIPVQLDFGSIKVDDLKQSLIFGSQIGYAWFINKNIVIEPQVRYSISAEDKDYIQYENIFSARIGFSLHF